MQELKINPTHPPEQTELELREVLAGAIGRLARAGCDTPRLDAEVLLAHALQVERTWLYLHPRQRLALAGAARFEALLAGREQRQPVAYLTGHKEFFGLDFEVTPAVLIPRPETELLVETALALLAGRDRPVIVDVGTGSGCIAVALASRLPEARLVGLDISGPALLLARRNGRRHGVAGRLALVQGNLLQALAGPVDLIASNPPYLSGAELRAASPEVGRYEPALALDGGADGLALVRQLLPQAAARLQPGGSLLVELGASQGPAVASLAATCFPGAAIQVKKDLAGLDRLLVVSS